MDNIVGTCIYYSDKIDIDNIITEGINKLDISLSRIRNSHKDLIALGANPDELEKRYESKKSKLKNLLVRVRNTPDCK